MALSSLCNLSHASRSGRRSWQCRLPLAHTDRPVQATKTREKIRLGQDLIVRRHSPVTMVWHHSLCPRTILIREVLTRERGMGFADFFFSSSSAGVFFFLFVKHPHPPPFLPTSRLFLSSQLWPPPRPILRFIASPPPICVRPWAIDGVSR